MEKAIEHLEPIVKEKCGNRLSSRWLALKLLDQDESRIQEINAYMGEAFLYDESLQDSLTQAKKYLATGGVKDADMLKDLIVSVLVKSAEEICRWAITYHDRQYAAVDRKLDKVLTSKLTGYPVMLVLLAFVFWLTITGANYPSQFIANGLFGIQDKLTDFFIYIQAPDCLPFSRTTLCRAMADFLH